MTSDISINKSVFGYVAITPSGTLEDTAQNLGQVLGLEFYEDDTGSFDEFPAFRAEGLDCEFALLGLPDEEFYVSSEPIEHFDLKIENKGNANIATGQKVSDYFIEVIKKSGTLNCWALD